MRPVPVALKLSWELSLGSYDSHWTVLWTALSVSSAADEMLREVDLSDFNPRFSVEKLVIRRFPDKAQIHRKIKITVNLLCRFTS